MIETPQIGHTTAQLTAVIRLTIPREHIQQVMGPAMGEVIAAVTAQGIGPGGPVFSHHFRMEPGTFDFEVGVPVSAPVTPVGRVQAGRVPAERVARSVYTGSYDGLGQAWGEFDRWINTHGHTSASDLWEWYLTGPESSPDPGTWRTELNRPLIG
jgi:effector-binding domain-containing protein